ncbi:MAG TPA: TetR/AcrR family transcriptional regulator [Gammaproteobacteria bacterium]
MNTRKSATAADVDNRSRLLHAATDAFAEFGYEGASLRAIADTAGVSFQLIAYYFGSKEELWIATVDFLFERYLETGKGLGFTSSGNLAEQFHNHLRLLLTDMLQRPQLRKIWIQEYLADSPRYHNVIRPKIKLLYETLSLPYFTEVVRLGIVERFTAEEISVLWSSIVQNNVVYPYYVELALGVPAGSAKSVESQVDLAFAILTEKRDAASGEPALVDVEARGMPLPAAHSVPSPSETVVYAWKEREDVGSQGARTKQLEIENLHLKQLVGNLSLEKKLLLERLAALEPTQRGKRDA